MARMRQPTSSWGSILLVTALLWAGAMATPSIPMKYCAGFNTASTAANESIYQSDGLCYGFCQTDYAFAVVKGNSCWCSNYVPDKSTQVSTSECDDPCPGFPSDVCGGDGVYGYMSLGNDPSGTSGAQKSTTLATSVSTSKAKVTTRVETSTVQKTVQTTLQATVTYTPPTSSSSSSTRESSSSAPTPAANGIQTTSQTDAATTESARQVTITVGGTVKTVLTTPTAGAEASSSANSAGITSSESSHGLSAGAAAGVAIGVVVALLAVGAVIAWLMIKRRRKAAEEMDGINSPGHRGSSAGIMVTPRSTEVSETRYYMGGAAASSNPSAPGAPERRRSTLMPVDPRLDPFAKGIYNRAENKSHESVNTLEDNHDYSRRIQEPQRVLRAINPDPDYD